MAKETRPTVAKRMFAAKEAAYKAQYPASNLFLPFSAMWVCVLGSLDAFEATMRQDAGPWRVGDVFRGRFSTLEDHLVTGVVASR